jgi:hypothetical protein
MVNDWETLLILIDNELLLSFGHLLLKTDGVLFLRRKLLLLQVLYLKDEVLLVCLESLVLSSLALLVVSLNLIDPSNFLNLLISFASSL